MRQVQVFKAEEFRRAQDFVSNFCSIVSPSERVRVIMETSSEFSTDTKDIRGFYWGWVIPNAGEAFFNEDRAEIAKSPAKRENVHLKLKTLLLPTQVQHTLENGKIVKKECVGSMKNATVRQWYVYIRAVIKCLKQHWGVDLDQVDHSGRDEFAVWAHKLEETPSIKREVAKATQRLEKGLRTMNGVVS